MMMRGIVILCVRVILIEKDFINMTKAGLHLFGSTIEILKNVQVDLSKNIISQF